jgi:hypothetical protein
LKTIGKGAFEECNNLRDFGKINKALTKIDDKAFSNCNINKIEFNSEEVDDYIIDSNLTTIGAGAFKNNENLNCELKLNEKLKTIDDEAFLDCGLSKLDMS